MQTKLAPYKNHAVVISPDDLRKITEIVRQNYGEPKFTFSRADGSEVETENLDDVIGSENFTPQRIESLTIRAARFSGERSKDYSACHVAIKRRSNMVWDAFIEDHEEKRAYEVQAALIRRMEACRPAYSFLTHVPPTLIWGLLSALYVLFWMAVLALGGAKVPTSMPWMELVSLGTLAAILMVPILLYADKAWAWLLPRLWFKIGLQSQEFDRRTKLRSTIAVGVLLAFVIGIAVNVATLKLTSP